LESELFGHERGAFSGAVARSVGRFETADGGTLFLDEIGDLPLELQPKLLRALQERQIERLGGGGRQLPVDVRIIAATNQDLLEMVGRRGFRADLYYRLSVFPIALPPLRERAGDIEALVEHFVRQFASRHGKRVEQVSHSAMEALRSHAWPGNVRELQNVIERAVIAGGGSVLEAPGFESHRCARSAPGRTLVEVERDHILATLEEAEWVIGGWAGAAARLGLPRTSLIARMQRLGISRAGAQVEDRGKPSGRNRGTARHAVRARLGRELASAHPVPN
jgi:formate hydrogenlyase transcriptional activator